MFVEVNEALYFKLEMSESFLHLYRHSVRDHSFEFCLSRISELTDLLEVSLHFHILDLNYY